MFNPDYLKEINFSKYQRIGVAFSGGIDSMVLLHSLSLRPENKKKLYALHVNHGINSKSSLWEEHCRKICLSLNIKFISFKLDSFVDENSNENDLREARYDQLLSWADEGDVLCTAHHKDDQIETILFRILRGTGIKGLEGIKKLTAMRNIDLVRPLLDFCKEDLVNYAQLNKLSWVEDESNLDLSKSRNFLRNTIVPLLAKKWPQYSSSFIKISAQAKDTRLVLEEVADSDIKNCLGDSFYNLSMIKMAGLSEERTKNLLHRWLILNTKLSVSKNFVEQIYRIIFLSRRDSNPLFSLGKAGSKDSFQIGRFRDHLYLLPNLEIKSLEAGESWSWDIHSPLELPTGILSSKKVYGEGLSLEFSHKNLLVKARSGGERCKPLGRSKSQKLKKLLQEYSVPPWLRDRLPLIFVQEEIAAVADLWVCEEFKAEENEAGFLLRWSDNLNKTTRLEG